MQWIIGIIILVVASVIYALANMRPFGSNYIECVEAGPSDSVDSKTLKSHSIREKNKWIIGKNGWPISMRNKIRVVVHGNCMNKRGISDNDQLVVQKLNPKEIKKLKPGDIVMIHLKDKDIDKIREFRKFTKDMRLDTAYYLPDGSIKSSSKPHTAEQIVGKVKYKL